MLALGVLYLLRTRRQLELLALQIRELREHATQTVTYHPVGSPELADALMTITAEAEKLGFTMLGDFLEDSAVRPAGSPMRWFVDARGTTFGWMAPFEIDGERVIVIVLMSHELASQTITSRAPVASSLTRPPFVTTCNVPLKATFEETVAKHREVAQLDDDTRGFVPVRTFEQLRHELERMRSKAIAWREHQPAADLLEADLRSLLGAQYRKLAGAMRRRLA
jgi:hypothetical protein